MEFIIYLLLVFCLFRIVATIIRVVKERKIVNSEGNADAEETRKSL